MLANWNFFLWFILASYGIDGVLSVLAGLLHTKKSDVEFYGTYTAATGLVKIIFFIILLILTLG